MTGQDERPDGGPAAAARGVWLRTVGFGLAAGWLNLATVLALRVLDPRVSMASLRTNREFLWMVPASGVVLFAAAGLVPAAWAWWRPAPAGRAGWRVLTGLAVLACLLDVEGLYGWASVALAAGAGWRLGPAVEALAARHARPLRWGLAASAVALPALGVATHWAVTTAERRALAALPGAPAGAPNVLLVVLDNVRAESLSLLGRDRPTTPNLQRLAGRGVVFTQARAPSSWTLASHASLFTGRWCHELDFDFDRPLDRDDPTLAETLAARGYATAGFVGNTYYGNTRYGLNRGFARYEDHYENLEVSPFEVVRSSGLGKVLLGAAGVPIRVEEQASVRKTGAMINRDVLAWLDARPRGRPFFVFANYFDAHAPFVPPDADGPRFGLATLPRDRQAALLVREADAVRGKVPGAGPAEIARAQAEAAALRRDAYETCIASLDRQVGRLFDELDRRGLTRDTLVVVTSDHGEHFAERGFYGHGLSLYRPEVHVPLLIFPPSGRPAGRIVDEPVSLRDVAATVLDLLALPSGTAPPLPGRSLARFWRAGGEPAEPVLSDLGHRRELPPTRSVPTSLGPLKALVDGCRVYIRNGDGREELYDLSVDPSESRDLAAHPAHRPAVERLRDSLDDLLDGPDAPPTARVEKPFLAGGGG